MQFFLKQSDTQSLLSHSAFWFSSFSLLFIFHHFNCSLFVCQFSARRGEKKKTDVNFGMFRFLLCAFLLVANVKIKRFGMTKKKNKSN